jgi:hypothetical protein
MAIKYLFEKLCLVGKASDQYLGNFKFLKKMQFLVYKIIIFDRFKDLEIF